MKWNLVSEFLQQNNITWPILVASFGRIFFEKHIQFHCFIAISNWSSFTDHWLKLRTILAQNWRNCCQIITIHFIRTNPLKGLNKKGLFVIETIKSKKCFYYFRRISEINNFWSVLQYPNLNYFVFLKVQMETILVAILCDTKKDFLYLPSFS